MSNINDPVVAAHASLMIPGARDASALMRFAATREAGGSLVDVTMDAVTIAERQREGGGAERERRPVRVPRWTVFTQRVSAIWRLRRTSPPLSSGRERAAVAPNIPA